MVKSDADFYAVKRNQVCLIH